MLTVDINHCDIVGQLNAAIAPSIAKYIHWGATTLDIMDDTSMLQIRSGLGILKRQIGERISTLRQLCPKYCDTPMAGRTHLKHALPCTFGYKCAVYLFSIVHHAESLAEIERRYLLVQFAGAAERWAWSRSPLFHTVTHRQPCRRRRTRKRAKSSFGHGT